MTDKENFDKIFYEFTGVPANVPEKSKREANKYFMENDTRAFGAKGDHMTNWEYAAPLLFRLLKNSGYISTYAPKHSIDGLQSDYVYKVNGCSFY